MYYNVRLSFNDGDDCCYVEGCFCANSKEDLDEDIHKMAKENGFPEHYDIDIQETTIEEMIETEKDNLWNQLLNDYIFRTYGIDSITAREYLTLRRELSKDNDKLYQMLKDEEKYIRIENLVRKNVNIKEISLFDFETLVMDLYNAKTGKEFEKILSKRKSKK